VKTQPSSACAALDDSAEEGSICGRVNDTLNANCARWGFAIGLGRRGDAQLGYLNMLVSGGNTYGIESGGSSGCGVSAKDITLPVRDALHCDELHGLNARA
jgi:hypothetical protein